MGVVSGNTLLVLLIVTPVLLSSLAFEWKLVLQINAQTNQIINVQTNELEALPSHLLSPYAELQHLVSSHQKYNCPNGLTFVEDHILPYNITHPVGRKIPNLLHITAKSRCMTQPFASNVDRWKQRLGEKYSIFIHDDDAVNKFLYEKRWKEFPELKEIMSCVTAGVSKMEKTCYFNFYSRYLITHLLPYFNILFFAINFSGSKSRHLALYDGVGLRRHLQRHGL